MTGPNLLVVIADQFRASALGCLQQDPTHTPHLDHLADGGRLLTHATSTHPVCSPARAMLLSGEYPWDNGVPRNVNSETAPDGVGLRVESRCWSDVLADAGYRMGYIDKWHLTPPTEDDEVYGEGRRDDGKVWDAWTPPDQRHGFSFWYSHGCCDHHLQPHYWTTDAARDEPLQVDQWSAEHETDVAIGFLRDSAAGPEQPFGLVVSLNPPHQPFDEVPEEYVSRYAGLTPEELLPRPNVKRDSAIGREAADIARLYFAAITAIDEQVGRILAELDRLGLADDTIVVFTSDHGMQLGSQELMYKNVPFEESARVPFVLRWPGRVAPGRDDLLLGSVDVAPTLLGLMGQADQVPAQMVGVDCSDALLDREGAQRPSCAPYLGPPFEPGEPDVRGLRTATHKIVVAHHPDAERSEIQLFDLEADPYELRNLADSHPALCNTMLHKLEEQVVRTGDPWPGLASLRCSPGAGVPTTPAS